MAGAVGQEVIDNLTVGIDIVPGCRPTDHAELVVIAFADGIGAVFNKETNDGEELLLGGEMQRRGIIALATDVRVGAAFEEEAYGSFLHSDNGLVKSGSHAGAARFIDERGVRIEQLVDQREVSTACCFAQGVYQ